MKGQKASLTRGFYFEKFTLWRQLGVPASVNFHIYYAFGIQKKGILCL